VVKTLNRNERGIALLVVLMAIALMTLIVMDFSTAAALGYLSSANQANELRSYYLARSAVSVGLGLLTEDSRIDARMETPFDSLNDAWAVPLPPVDVDGGTVTVAIVDEARKLNINQLVNTNDGQINPQFAATLERLFSIIGITPKIIPAIADWLDPDSIESPNGAELGFYLRLNPPYAPRNGPMPTIGDLKMIRGIDDATFKRLLPFLTVEPEMQVNANTAPPEVLASLLPELYGNANLINEIITARMIRPFVNLTDVGNLPGFGQMSTQLSQVLTTRSNFFTISAMGTFAGARKVIYSTFRRQPDGSGMLAAWQEN